MKSFLQTLPLATALFAASSVAWLPSCGWTNCVGSWDGTSCSSSNGWDCVCTNSTEIANLNSCVASSCTNVTDQEAIYGAIAQLCANAGASVTASPEATFSATSGGSAWPSQITAGPGGGPWGNNGGWSSWVSACSTALPGAPSGWNGGQWGGPGNGWNSRNPFGGANCAFTTWTGGWGPFSSWTGTWSGCSTTTASPVAATITTTVNGQVVTGTTFGVQAVATTSGTAASSTNTSGASSVRSTGACGALVLAIVATLMAL